jgi:predicted O-linked N-acetylglucosamine transferase (SPINDLY family)
VRDATRAEFDLPEDAFVMAAFGNVYKITPEMFATWMDILKEIPRAVLWLIDDNATTTANLKAHALKAGADVERILFTPRASHEEYRVKLKMADVFLDTFPYNCGSTTNDVINAGVPLVTMSGRTMVSRMGGAILSMLSLQNSIALNHADYKKLIHQQLHQKKQSAKEQNANKITSTLESNVNQWLRKAPLEAGNGEKHDNN